jgi:hypothetical protein
MIFARSRPLGPLVLLPALLLACATSRTNESLPLVRPQFLVPASLGARITELALEVYTEDSGVSCNEETGVLDGIKNGLEPLERSVLKRCDQGFCGELNLARNNKNHIFYAVAKAKSEGPFMVACRATALDSENLDLNLTLRRYAKASCGNGKRELAEQCDPLQALCEQCKTSEVVLSQGSDANQTNRTSNKDTPRLLWEEGQKFVAAWDDDGDVALRSFTPELETEAAPRDAAFFMPTVLQKFPGTSSNTLEKSPRIVSTGDTLGYAIAYASTLNASSTAIQLRYLNADFQTTANAPVAISMATGKHQNPALARLGNNYYVAWEDPSTASIYGRPFDNRSVLGGIVTIGELGSTGSLDLAATRTGFAIVWERQGAIQLRFVNPTGTPQGGSVSVNATSNGNHRSPRIASLPDGRFVVSWLVKNDDGTRIMYQRYNASGGRIEGDQNGPLVDANVESAPVPIALGGDLPGFAIGFLDGGTVRARYLDAVSGFLLNDLDGTEQAFEVSVGDGNRSALTGVSHDSTKQFFFAWRDEAKGIVGRWFPYPSQ